MTSNPVPSIGNSSVAAQELTIYWAQLEGQQIGKHLLLSLAPDPAGQRPLSACVHAFSVCAFVVTFIEPVTMSYTLSGHSTSYSTRKSYLKVHKSVLYSFLLSREWQCTWRYARHYRDLYRRCIKNNLIDSKPTCFRHRHGMYQVL